MSRANPEKLTFACAADVSCGFEPYSFKVQPPHRHYKVSLLPPGQYSVPSVSDRARSLFVEKAQAITGVKGVLNCPGDVIAVRLGDDRPAVRRAVFRTEGEVLDAFPGARLEVLVVKD